MITLIYGGSGSGKSAFAEDYVLNTHIKNRFYLATMMSSDEESKNRIQRHRKLRDGKGFVTLEHGTDIVNAITEIESISTGEFSTYSNDESIVLLECMSNLVANEMFADGRMCSAGECADKILTDIKKLNECVTRLVVVTNNIFEDGKSYDEGTKEYMRSLGKINLKLREMAHETYEVVVGIGIKI